MIPYDRAFYKTNSNNSSSSAGQVVPYLVSLFRPQSVVDVGCGIGTWAAEFRRQGVPDVIGIDGAYVDKSQLRIPESSFLSWDLERPLASGQSFDLAVSLEVAEHLRPSRAASFVEDLIRLAPLVVFSAAVPLQGGTNHVNEQWGSYWNSLFAAKGFHSVDCLRARFWNDPGVAVWYRQNMMVYASEERVQEFAPFDQTMPRDAVHPELFDLKMTQPRLKVVLKSLPGALKRCVKLRLFGDGSDRIPRSETSSAECVENFKISAKPRCEEQLTELRPERKESDSRVVRLAGGIVAYKG
jgi:SAM-dependent methyltransferase